MMVMDSKRKTALRKTVIRLMMLGALSLTLGAVALPGADANAKGRDTDLAATTAGSETTRLRTQDEALTKAEQLPFVPDNALLQQAVLSYNSSTLQWDLSLAKPDKDKNRNWTLYCNVRLSALDGSLLGMNLADSHPDVAPETASDGLPVDRKGAEQIATSFIDGLKWGLDAVWKIDTSPESDYDNRFEDPSLFRVRFYRSVNGIPYDQMGFIIDVRPNGGIASYNASWSAVRFAATSGIIPAVRAEQIFNTRSAPVLKYLRARDGTPLLVYDLWQTTMDAATGTFPQEKNVNHYPDSGHRKAISAKPLEPLVTNAKMTDRQMRDRINKLLHLSVPYTISKPRANLFKLVIPTKDKNRFRSVQFEFDPNTRQLKFYSSDDGIDHSRLSKAKVNENQARQAAVAFLKAVMPAYVDQLSESRVDLFLSDGQVATRPLYRLTFDRVAGGILVDQENIEVDVNAYTGQVESVRSQLSSLMIPPHVMPAISAQKAVQRLMSLYKVELQYNWIGVDQAGLFYRLKLKPSVPRFYRDMAPVLDANTGAWRNPIGEPLAIFD